MKYLHPLLSFLLLVLATVSCQGPAMISAPQSISFAYDGTQETISITVNRDWSISSSESWCTVSPQSGISSDEPVTITVRCQANSTYDERKAQLTIMTDEISHRITVTQAQRDAVLSEESVLRADGKAQDLTIHAETNVDFTVTVLDGKDWIKPAGTKGLSKKDVSIHIEENRSGAVREGAVQLSRDKASTYVQVRQAPWHDALDKTTPGLYGVKGNDYLYRTGASQISHGQASGTSFFRILTPDPPMAISVDGISEKTTITDALPLNVRLVAGEDGVIYQSAVPATVLRESDSLVWFQLSGNVCLIVKK